MILIDQFRKWLTKVLRDKSEARYAKYLGRVLSVLCNV